MGEVGPGAGAGAGAGASIAGGTVGGLTVAGSVGLVPWSREPAPELKPDLLPFMGPVITPTPLGS